VGRDIRQTGEASLDPANSHDPRHFIQRLRHFGWRAVRFEHICGFCLKFHVAGRGIWHLVLPLQYHSPMKYAAAIFLLIAVIAGFPGLTGYAGAAVELAKAVCSLSMCLSAMTALAALLQRRAFGPAGSTGNRRELFSAVP
jgi:uncharacterized membrane protein YtjA (UPF0391 family)